MSQSDESSVGVQCEKLNSFFIDKKGQDMEIEDCKLVNGWLLVNANHDPVKNNWQYQFFGREHSLSEAYELHIAYQSERINPIS